MESHNQESSKGLAGSKACVKGVQAKGLQVWLSMGHILTRCPGQRHPCPVSFYSCFNGSLILLYLYFSRNRWVKHLKKIDSSSNAHFLRDNSRHLLSSNDLLHLHGLLYPLSYLRKGLCSTGFTVEETKARRRGVSWSRSQELVSSGGSPVLSVL